MGYRRSCHQHSTGRYELNPRGQRKLMPRQQPGTLTGMTPSFAWMGAITWPAEQGWLERKEASSY